MTTKETVFDIFKIGNKELAVSNLLCRYLVDPQCGKQLLNDILELAGAKPLSSSDEYKVDREKHFDYIREAGGKGKNSVDIFVNINNGKRILVIENKIYSNEGHKQTLRYFNSVKQEFGNAEDITCIYLTKTNSAVILSADNAFVHIKYRQLCEKLRQQKYRDLPFVVDFCEFYVDEEERMNKNNPNKNISSIDCDGLVQYIVWKINGEADSQYSDIYCAASKSPKSGASFFQARRNNWVWQATLADASVKMNLHLETSSNGLALHLETLPYMPLSQLTSKYGQDFVAEYDAMRDRLRSNIASLFAAHTALKMSKIRGNAYLTVASFDITAVTYEQYFDAMMQLIEIINDNLFLEGSTPS